MLFNPKTTQELIQNITTANQNGGSHTIILQPQFVYELTAAQDTSHGKSGLPAIAQNMTFIGNGATIKRAAAAQENFRLFLITSGVTVELQGLTLSGGYIPANEAWPQGGAIVNQGTLTLKQCRIVNNATQYGGGVINDASGSSLTLINSFIKDNEALLSAGGTGGGILNGTNSTLKATNCHFEHNLAPDEGGALATSGILTLMDCLFKGNQAAGRGAAVHHGNGNKDVSIQFCDFYENDSAQGSCLFVDEFASGTVKVNYNRIFNNVVSTGQVVQSLNSSNTLLAENNWWGTADGPAGQGSGSGDSVGLYVDYAPFLDSDVVVHEGTCECGFNHAGDDCTTSGNPISLRLGEKRLEVTDLSVVSPAEALTFTRTYRQSKQSGADAFAFMGLGWTHNQRIYLDDPGSQQPILLYMPKGGVTRFDYRETISSKDYYQGAAGSTARLVVDAASMNAKYTLTAADQTLYVFDDDGQLRSRQWPNGETWTYTYDGSDNLITVEDDYGRQLQFVYHSGHAGDDAYKNGQLWRIGDHNTTSLTGNPPSGRYIELDYTPEKDDGATITTPQALLQSVRDVRGNTWTYAYYGQESGEDNAALLNLLIERQSPSVDTNGDGSPDGSLILEQLDYIYDSELELAVNGSMEADSDWSDIGTPTTNERSTAQVDGGTYARHVVTDAVSEGIGGNSWNLVDDRSYTITARVYPVSGTVKMQVSGTAAFDDTSLSTGGWETLSATHTPTANTSGHQLQFVASGGTAEFYVDTVSILETNPDLGEIIQKRGVEGANVLEETTFVFGPNGQDSTLQTIAGKTTTHVFDRGLYAGAQDAAGNSQANMSNGRFRSSEQVDANGNRTWLNWDPTGKRLEQVSDALGHETAFEYDSADRLHSSRDTEGRKTLYLYEDEDAPRQPTLILVTDGGDLAINGGMELDSDWGSVNAPSTNERSSTQVDMGSYARRVVASASGQGIQGTAFDLSADRLYIILARVYVVSGAAKLQVTDTSGFDTTTSTTGVWETLRAVYSPSSLLSAKQLQFLSDGGAAEFYVDSVHIFDATQLLRWQEFTYDSQGRTLTEKLIDPADGSTVQQQVTRSYYTTGNGNGLLETVTQEEIGGTNDVTTTYFYDSVGRIVQTNRNSNFGSCQRSYTVYDTAGNVVASLCNYDPGMSAAPTNVAEAIALYDEQTPEVNQVTTYVYDEIGRRVATTANAGASFAQTTLTFYDALHRVWRTISNFVDASYDPPGDWVWESGLWKDGVGGTPIDHGTDNTQNFLQDTAYNAWGQLRWQRDTLGHVTLFGYDAANRLVRTIQNASSPDYDNDSGGDPDLSAYTPGSNPDEDVSTTNAYDAVGNLVQTTDALGAVHYSVYDALNRPVKTVRAAKATATIALNPGDGGYDAANDPRSASYTPSSDPDRDQMATTEYDALGRVIRTQRLLENRPAAVWETTLYGYDTLGRQVRVIRFASDPDYDVLSDPDLSAYTPSSNPDEDIISVTVYDDHGRVLYNEDPLAARSWIGYDGLGRAVKTIANAVGTAQDGGSNDPRSASYTPSGDPDKDLVSQTVYDTSGRVQSTTDALGRVTYNVYDGDLARIIRTIRNYVVQGMSVPDDWEWDAGDDRWEDGAGNAIAHGTDGDQNLISETVYDARGRVETSYDQRHNASRFVYDILGRRVMTITNYVAQDPSVPEDWEWDAGDDRWEDGAGNAIDHGSANDQNLITTTGYDLAGRVSAIRDTAGRETRFSYDGLGRRTQTIANYDDGLYSAAAPDADLISSTVYNRGGQVLSATDARGTQTAFTYDAAGRRLTLTQAANSDLATTSRTCYDKAGRVLRTIQNWEDAPGSPDPDARDGSGDWLFAPQNHGSFNDRNLVVEYAYDGASRRTQMTDPAGQSSLTAYFKDGQVQASTDPEGTVTQYRYDGLRRRIRVIAGFVDNGEDPQDWVWDVGDGCWEESDGTPLAHGTDNDQNILVDVTYDKGERVTAQRDPNGHLTTFSYDALNRRLTRTNPLSQTWTTVYADLFASGATRTTMTYPGITGAADYTVQRDFDRLGRLSSLQYGDPSSTPDVQWAYDLAGMRTQLREYSGAGFTSRSRQTTFSYDDARRLTAVDFDTDGDGSVEETVSYAYDAGGLRTQLTLPGALNIAYTYDARGQLVGLTDWDGSHHDFFYDRLGRHIRTQRPNQLVSDYRYTPAGHLRRIRHFAEVPQCPRAHFEYVLDGRGNRTQAYERLAQPTSISATYDKDHGAVSYIRGTWTDDGDFKQSTQFSARMQLVWAGDEGLLTVGTGPDHGIFDVYSDGSLWQSYDGYAADPGERLIHIPVAGTLEIRNRHERNTASSGYVVRFKQLAALSVTYDEQVIDYSYDALSRLLEADYDSGDRVYDFAYDRAGNRLAELLSGTGVTPADRYFGYNEANQLVVEGATLDGNNEVIPDHTYEYDANGNLVYKKDTVPTTLETHTWDRANRLLTAPGSTSYAYDGLGNRIQQTVSSVVTDYLLDTQPGLAKVIAAATGANTERYLHAPMGIHAMQDNAGNWTYPVQDGLGSVRGVASDVLAVNGLQHYAPYGDPFGAQGSLGMPFGFTSEQTDGNGQVFLRARYYNPTIGVFNSLDPFEGIPNRPMSLNSYSWVEGNPVMNVDPRGMFGESPSNYADCTGVDCTDAMTSNSLICEFFTGDGGTSLGVGTSTVSVVDKLAIQQGKQITFIVPLSTYERLATRVGIGAGVVSSICYAQQGDNARAVWNLGLTLLAASSPVGAAISIGLTFLDAIIHSIQANYKPSMITPPPYGLSIPCYQHFGELYYPEQGLITRYSSYCPSCMGYRKEIVLDAFEVIDSVVPMNLSGIDESQLHAYLNSVINGVPQLTYDSDGYNLASFLILARVLENGGLENVNAMTFRSVMNQNYFTAASARYDFSAMLSWLDDASWKEASCF